MRKRRSRLPSVLRLDRAALRSTRAEGVHRIAGAEAWRGPTPKGSSRGPAEHETFHFTNLMWRLCRDICEHTAELRHVDMDRVLVTFVRSRNDRRWGLQAKLVPLRFEGGRRRDVRRGRVYEVQRIYLGPLEMHYVLSFYLPRFLNQTFSEKLVTIFHELYHIHPECPGDIRRFHGSAKVHSPSARDYDLKMAELAKRYLSQRPPSEFLYPLRLTFEQLRASVGEIVGVEIPAPKLFPLREPLLER